MISTSANACAWRAGGARGCSGRARQYGRYLAGLRLEIHDAPVVDRAKSLHQLAYYLQLMRCELAGA